LSKYCVGIRKKGEKRKEKEITTDFLSLFINFAICSDALSKYCVGMREKERRKKKEKKRKEEEITTDFFL
jgi:hypothetical protein